MELNEQLKDQIADIFNKVEYGRITFFLSPEKKDLNYSIETTGKLPINARNNAILALDKR